MPAQLAFCVVCPRPRAPVQETCIKGARTHNLKGINLTLRPGELVVVVGPSGSGKSSLAFDTLHVEGQRRFVESFSPYVRQFLERSVRPPVEELHNVPASMAVDRQAPVKTSRSTVGTMTDLLDYSKELWACKATLECSGCGKPVASDDVDSAAAQVFAEGDERGKLLVTRPLVVQDREAFIGVRESLLKEGFTRVYVGGSVRDLSKLKPSECVPYKRKQRSNGAGGPEVVVDRLSLRSGQQSRLREALEAAYAETSERAVVRQMPTSASAGKDASSEKTWQFSRQLHCAYCDLTYEKASPALFSFNNPVGACPDCRGFGRIIAVDWGKVFPSEQLTLKGGAIKPWTGRGTQWERRTLVKNCKRAGVPMDVPLASLSAEQRDWLVQGDSRSWKTGWPGLAAWFQWMETRTYKMHVRVLLSRYRKYETCPTCDGTRFQPYARQWKIAGQTVSDFLEMPVSAARDFVRNVSCSESVSLEALREACEERLALLCRLGLEYLTLNRAARSLSGGEAQRVALAAALGTSLSSAMFILDEPTVGLHPQDTTHLLQAVRELTDRDNVCVLVEHDLSMIRGADRVVELGPGAGAAGGEIVFDGTPAELARAYTATGLALRKEPESHDRKRPARWLRLRGARGHNLQGIDFCVPVGLLSCVTGVSGSGKSSLVIDTFLPALRGAKGETVDGLAFDSIEGAQHIKDVVWIDQTPIGRTSRGNPATYLKVWDLIRKKFAQEALSRSRGYGPGHFSFNVNVGRCEACKGEGSETVEMQFMADVSFPCPVCRGTRFKDAVLEVKFRSKSVADWLQMSVSQVVDQHGDLAEVARRLRPLVDLGLGYLQLGQSLSTLSGGEGQRLRMAKLFAEIPSGSLIALDEPTAGLHPQDTEGVLVALRHQVRRGCTVLVVEHDMRMAAAADHLIDLGPGGGAAGGRVVAAGAPEEVAALSVRSSATVPFLRAALGIASGASKEKTPKRVEQRQVGPSPVSIVGAQEHNLKGVTIDIPKEQLVVVTGPSGSGKSSLVFDVLHAEAQRRYLETLSPYARRYMPQLPRPRVEHVLGVPPSVALSQRMTRGGSNSTVATLTEVAHYLRLLFAKLGVLHCPNDNTPITPIDPDALVATLQQKAKTTKKAQVCALVLHARKGAHRALLDRLRRDGIETAWIDGEEVKLKSGLSLDRYEEHTIEAVVGAAAPRSKDFNGLVRMGLSQGEGSVVVRQETHRWLFSTSRTCVVCGTGYPELDPRFFSFNTVQGGCQHCEGAGLVITGRGENHHEVVCSECEGTRLSPLARSVLLHDAPITHYYSLSVARARQAVASLQFGEREQAVGGPVAAALLARLDLLISLGLGYLELSRAARTLSGGEVQRVRLSAQLGSGQTGLLFALDEPTIGLHPRDTQLLLDAFRRLTQSGCSVVVVEHDLDTMRCSDHLIELGPGGGSEGGSIVAAGGPADFASKETPTGIALATRSQVPSTERVSPQTPKVDLRGARHHNLKGVDVAFPHGCLTVVTGVSGSGKSSLVRQVLYPAVRDALGLVTPPPGVHQELSGLGDFRRALEVDQSPIGRTSRSVPATYLGTWTLIRDLLAATPEARALGFAPSRFSFNAKAGRCEVCGGQGFLAVEMSFLPNAQVDCPKCAGKRFNEETLCARWRGYSAGDLLDLEIRHAVEVFEGVHKIVEPLRMLNKLGLGYLKLGQPSNTLSGGEAQRLKLVSELNAPTQQGTALYVLDEPTTGLHRQDVGLLIQLLQLLVERGDTVVVVEHHLDVMLAADWIIDLGPEGGEDGGQLVAQGTPRDFIATCKGYTADALREELAQPPTTKPKNNRSDRKPKSKRAIAMASSPG